MKQIELLVLAALMDGPAHGYSVAQYVGELTGGRVEVRPGNLYRVLDRIEERGWVREADAQPGAGEDERRRYFELTQRGRRAAEAELRMYADILARAGRMRERTADA